MSNYCKYCDSKLWSNCSKQKGKCPECEHVDGEPKDLEETLDELLSSPTE